MVDKTIPLPQHGGDLTFATRVYGKPAGGWLDLSTGINPHAYAAPPIPPETLHRLPDKEALLKLVELARRAYGVPGDVDLIAVPGTEAAIRQLRRSDEGIVAIVGPTYGTYGRVWPDARHVSSAAEAADADTLVVVNPNNPDGRQTPPATMPSRPFLIVDEAFADSAPEASLIPHLRGRSALVLRSFGKFYGLPGLRLGFVAGPQQICSLIADALGDWSVSGPAIAVGTVALADDAWREAMRAQLRSEMAALRTLLAGHGLQFAGGTDLFVLVDVDNARGLHQALATRGIWTRAFDYNPRWLRLGLPGAANMERLAAALSAVR